MSSDPLICENSNEEIVDVIISIGEKVSDVTLLPYQRPFAERILGSMLLGDANTITALFSRQCLDGETLIWTTRGFRKLMEVNPGDEIMALSPEGRLHIDTVTAAWKTDPQDVYRITVTGGTRLEGSDIHRFLTDDPENEWKSVATGLKNRDRLVFPLYMIQDSQWDDEPTNTPLLIGWDGENRKKAIRATLTLQWGKQSAGLSIMAMLGTGCWAKFDRKDDAEKIARELGTEVVPMGIKYGVKFTPLEGQEAYQAMMTYRKTCLEVLAASGGIRERKRGNEEPYHCISFPVQSSKPYRAQLRAWLSLLGIESIRLDSTDEIIVKNRDGIYLLADFFKRDRLYGKILHRLQDHSQAYLKAAKVPWKYVYRFLREHPGAMESFEHEHKDWKYRCRKDGMALPLFLNLLQLYANQPDKFFPPCVTRQIAKIEKLAQRRELWDIETEEGRYTAGAITHNCGKSETITVIIIGALLWLPALANTYPKDKRFKKFARGTWVGVFAPAIRQAKNVYRRVRKRLQSERGKEIMFELPGQPTFTENQAEQFELSNGSRLSAFPGHEEANVEAETLHLAIGDEAQDISSFKWKKSIVPMCTMTAGSKVLVGTANTKKSHFYDSIQLNIKVKEAGGVQNHFETDWTIPAKYIPEYKVSVEMAITEIGYNSDEFQMAYCNKFIFARGMFCEPEVLELYHPIENPKGLVHNYELTEFYTGSNPVSVGIDVGKTKDPTVAVAMECDVSAPIDTMNFRTYTKRIIGILEIMGDDIDTQCPRLLDFIYRMKANTVVVDSTGKGENFWEKLYAALPTKTVIAYRYSQATKSELFKNLNSDIITNRLQIPGGPATRRDRRFFKLIKELSDLEKDYLNQFMVVKAPNVRNAHDDYPNAVALAAHGCKDNFIGGVQVEKNDLFKRRRRR